MKPGDRVTAGRRTGVVRHVYDGKCDHDKCQHAQCVEVLVDGESSSRNFDHASLKASAQ